MKIVGTHPQQGMRVSLELDALDDRTAHYRGAAFTPDASHEVLLEIDVARGSCVLSLGEGTSVDPAREPEGLADADLAFLRQLGHQLFRLATQTPEDQGGGKWPRRVQRWRGPK